VGRKNEANKENDMIPSSDLEEGIRLCSRNVDQLLEDASRLYQTGSYGHAQALAILAMEEYAKKVVLVTKRAYPNRFGDEIRRSFQDHDFKLQLALDMLMREFPDAPSGERAANIVMELAAKLLSLRQVSLYVDYDNQQGWFDPNKADYRDVAAVQIKYANELVRRVDAWLTKI
jgi:AbiV family abortive infection protein